MPSVITARVIKTSYAKGVANLFSLDITHTVQTTIINMQVLTDFVSTSHLPRTRTVLRKLLPSILASKCFNENNFPFSKEVRCTEIGHLFEHIILEYLCIGKIARGSEKAVYDGVTSWDWVHNTYGTFTITINTGKAEYELFTEALGKSIKLLEIIMATSPKSLIKPLKPQSFFSSVEKTE